MKKLLVLPLLALPFAAFAAGMSPYEYVKNQVQFNGPSTTVATGSRGDTLVKVPADETLLKIYNIDKYDRTAYFLSIENPIQYVQEGHCLINVIEELNQFRVFCGTADDIKDATAPDSMYGYAVSIKKE